MSHFYTYSSSRCSSMYSQLNVPLIVRMCGCSTEPKIELCDYTFVATFYFFNVQYLDAGWWSLEPLTPHCWHWQKWWMHWTSRARRHRHVVLHREWVSCSLHATSYPWVHWPLYRTWLLNCSLTFHTGEVSWQDYCRYVHCWERIWHLCLNVLNPWLICWTYQLKATITPKSYQVKQLWLELTAQSYYDSQELPAQSNYIAQEFPAQTIQLKLAQGDSSLGRNNMRPSVTTFLSFHSNIGVWGFISEKKRKIYGQNCSWSQ